ncbi:adenine phosphoribosyltransferase [Actinokineospora baliensis]|uniref:adenine phosphoribosyltransferase n=1 Tax=Actinokineospora baliensis TaxID=547056 RepID=UPI001EF79B5D|nr:adenine phosphoribosyltransferase [Actinokineospora baliensis]MBM7775910.1 adenine phosphoribosyltransferase [Actinokineospora baliensis]
MTPSLDRALGLIRAVPDYPTPGVLFRDLTTLLADHDALRAVVGALSEQVPADTTHVVALEARGFLFGAAVAHALGRAVIPVRKPGKLPLVADSVTYSLEYGTATFELPADVLTPGAAVYLIDDVLATGGSLTAAAALATRAGATVLGAGVVLEITALGGRDHTDVPVHTVFAV